MSWATRNLDSRVGWFIRIFGQALIMNFNYQGPKRKKGIDTESSQSRALPNAHPCRNKPHSTNRSQTARRLVWQKSRLLTEGMKKGDKKKKLIIWRADQLFSLDPFCRLNLLRLQTFNCRMLTEHKIGYAVEFLIRRDRSHSGDLYACSFLPLTCWGFISR